MKLTKKQMLNLISDLLIKKGIEDKPVLEEITSADGTKRKQLMNHHKTLMNVYEQLNETLLNQELSILKHSIEKEGNKNADS
jgi:hypothetical protein